MNPNWSKLAALSRTLTILFAATFCGALILPLAADGTLPLTWGAWKPVLATALSASAVAEFVWIRSHLSAAAAAVGLDPEATKPEAPAPKRGFVRVPLVAILAMMALALFGVAKPTASGAGCSWWSNGGSSQVETAGGQVGSCILQAVLTGGAADPAAVVAQCSGATLGDVAAIVESLVAYYTQPQAPAAPPGLLDRLHQLDDRAKAALVARGS